MVTHQAVKVGGRDPFYFPAETEENREVPHSGYATFEPSAFQIEVKANK
jgi:hypothetical protein